MNIVQVRQWLDEKQQYRDTTILTEPKVDVISFLTNEGLEYSCKMLKELSLLHREMYPPLVLRRRAESQNDTPLPKVAIPSDDTVLGVKS